MRLASVETPPETASQGPSDAARARVSTFVEEAVHVTRQLANALGEHSRIRVAYVNETRAFASAILQRFDDGELTESQADYAATKLRDQALNTARGGLSRLSPAGRALSDHVKERGTTLQALMGEYARSLFGRSLDTLTVEEQATVCLELAEKAGLTDEAVDSTASWAPTTGRVMIAAAIAIAVYQVTAAEAHVGAGVERGPSLPGFWAAEPGDSKGIASIPVAWACAPIGGLVRGIADSM